MRASKFLKTTFVVCTLLTCALANGQFRLGTYAGYNNENFITREQVDSLFIDRSIGFIFGLQTEINLGPNVLLSFEPGMAFETSRLLTYPKAGITTTLAPRQSNLEPTLVDSGFLHYRHFLIPTMIKVLSKNRQWHFLGGISPIFPTQLYIYDDKGAEVSFSDLFNPVSLGAVMGIEYRLNIKESAVTLGVRYGQSVTRITETSNSEGFLSGLKSRSVRIILSWRMSVIRRLVGGE